MKNVIFLISIMFSISSFSTSLKLYCTGLVDPEVKSDFPTNFDEIDESETIVNRQAEIEFTSKSGRYTVKSTASNLAKDILDIPSNYYVETMLTIKGSEFQYWASSGSGKTHIVAGKKGATENYLEFSCWVE
jgi:hypothetical protein